MSISRFFSQGRISLALECVSRLSENRRGIEVAGLTADKNDSGSSTLYAARIRNLFEGRLHPSRCINHISERARELNFALTSITSAPDIPIARAIGFFYTLGQSTFPSLGEESLD